MTIYDKERFHYIYNGFKRIDQQTYHFCLLAKEETIHKRLIARGENEGNWCFQQTEKCVEAFDENVFGEFISTDDVGISEIVKGINMQLACP